MLAEGHGIQANRCTSWRGPLIKCPSLWTRTVYRIHRSLSESPAMWCPICNCEWSGKSITLFVSLYNAISVWRFSHSIDNWTHRARMCDFGRKNLVCFEGHKKQDGIFSPDALTWRSTTSQSETPAYFDHRPDNQRPLPMISLTFSGWTRNKSQLTSNWATS